MTSLQKILQDKFRLDDFREWQLEIIESIIAKNDTLVFMPTGWGKSLTYQFPWIMLPGLVIIISPLISLMKDQVDKLNAIWIRAELINSTISPTDKRFILDEISQNIPDEPWCIKFLYIAPERLNDEHFLRVIKNVDISLIAIDEAHCISQWWHDFRPSYLKIKHFLDDLRNPYQRWNNFENWDSLNTNTYSLFPIIVLTATATKKVRLDIVERLGLKKYKIFTSWFDRKNLIFIVREITKKEEKFKKVVEIIKKTPPYWIVYCSSVKAVKELYEHLKEEWINVWIYTGEMSANSRESEQNNFMDSSYDVIVATNAFGMWIDKKDIRYVIHYNLPWSIENYYQEAWRAWRDWKISYSIIIASYQDTIIQEFFIENAYPPKEDIIKLYNYLYKDFKIWEWAKTQILKTYAIIAKESDLKNDMKVWSIIKIFEKYWIMKRWFEWNDDTNDFRWRWITILLWKKEEKYIPILWNHQDVLKNESYFKLEQIKKLLFKPGCRKRFILEYFWDEEDIRNLWENCGVCDYCIDKKKFENEPKEDLVKINVFFIILEFVKKLDEKFWAQTLSWVLIWSKEKKILEWDLDLNPDYWILEELSKDIVNCLFEILLENWYLYKTFWQYPKIWISEKWRETIFDNSVLIDEKDSLMSALYMKARKYITKEEKTTSKPKTEKVKLEKVDTYMQTLALYKKWISMWEIAKERDFTSQTIEEHLIKLYTIWEISLNEIMNFSTLENLKLIKWVIGKNKLDLTKLKPIKDETDKLNSKISYFEIKICIAMINRKDL